MLIKNSNNLVTRSASFRPLLGDSDPIDHPRHRHSLTMKQLGLGIGSFWHTVIRPGIIRAVVHLCSRSVEAVDNELMMMRRRNAGARRRRLTQVRLHKHLLLRRGNHVPHALTSPTHTHTPTSAYSQW